MIALIAAVSKNNCIGTDGKLPWHLPEDMKHFKELTMGKTVLMGRKTWESIPEKFRPLPHRKNIVITRQEDYPLPEGVLKYTNIERALADNVNDAIFIIGGADIYRQTISRADLLYITHVHKEVAGNAFFPEMLPAHWKETEREDHSDFSFVTYSRV